MTDEQDRSPISVVVPEDVTRGAFDFMQRVLGPVGELGDFLTERIRFFRWKSAARTIERAKQIANDRGVDPKQVPIKFLVPFLEQCSLEDEDSELSEYWAKLLVDASARFQNKHLLYSDILSRLGSGDANLIRHFWSLVDSSFFLNPASFFQVFHSEYAERASYHHDTFKQLEPGAFDAWERASEARGQFFLQMEIINLSDDPGNGEPLPFDRYPVHDNNNTKLMDNAQYSRIIVLEREGLITVKGHVQEWDDKAERASIIWAELTPLGFDFVDTLEAGTQVK